MYRTLIALLLASGLSSLRGADEMIQPSPQPNRVRIPRVTRAPKLTDFLQGIPRENELVISDFRQQEPGDGVPVSQPSRAFLSYDDKNLYVGFIFDDDPALIRARIAKREQITQDDRFTICLDTFHDHRHSYWFDVNPYGVQADGNVTDGVEDDASWDTLWYSEARITGTGYTGLASIPFKSIRFPTDDEQTWGLIVGRLIKRNNEFSMWPHVSKKRPGFVQQSGDMEGLHGISAGRNVQLIPYGMFTASRYLDQPAAGAAQFRNDREARGGLDGKVVLKDAFTLDLTLNPDFSQVESDAPQVTVNQRYEVYFPEKRPFFMENAGYFKTPQQLFFSRRIIDPRFGTRFTGRVGKWALGALFADDRAPGEQVPADDPLHRRQAAVGVVRLQRDFLRNSNAALMATSSDFGSTHNRVYSIDTRLQLLRNWILTGQGMTSDTRMAGGKRLAGPAYFVDWSHAGRHFISTTTYTDRSPNFRANLGYFERMDIREVSHTAGYDWRPEASALVSFGPRLKGALNYDRQGRLQDWSVNPEFEIKLKRQTIVSFERFEGFELFSNLGFRKHHNEVGVKSDWQRWLSLDAEFSNGTSVNYYPGSGMPSFLGRMANVKAGFTLRPNPRTRIEQSYLYSSLKTDVDSIFNNHILRSTFNYQLNREISLRGIVDYNAVLPNGRLVSLEKAKGIGLDALFTYMLNPGTALHVGYTDLYENLRLNPTLSPALYRTAYPDQNTGRQVFVKLSYLLRF